MSEGLVLVALIVLVGVLVLVGFVTNAVHDCNAKRRHLPPQRTGSLPGR